jgi:hypothetical protein
MPKTSQLIVFALVAASCVFPLFGHHGTAASYDQKKTVTFEGTVVEFLWRNPHSALFVKGKDASGKEVEYSVEMGSPGQLVKSGVRRDTFKPGDHVILEVHPSFTNPTSGEMLSGKANVNGKQLGIVQ